LSETVEASRNWTILPETIEASSRNWANCKK
jgi:hypothetical protein